MQGKCNKIEVSWNPLWSDNENMPLREVAGILLKKTYLPNIQQKPNDRDPWSKCLHNCMGAGTPVIVKKDLSIVIY